MEEKNLNTFVEGGWLAVQQRYFITAWIPEKKQQNHYYSKVGPNNLFTIGSIGSTLHVRPGKTANIYSTLYLGPEIASDLKPLAKGLDLTIDYGWLFIFSNAIFWLMSKIYSVVGNWGWSIILVTLLIKSAFYKLSESSFRSMAKMRKLQPRMEALKTQYGNDKQKLSQETMKLYKTEKANPLGGCLPMIVQIPVFIALYYVLIESVQLRQAPFMFWIQDLSTKDPYYILPVLMGLSMFLQQKLSPAPTDPTHAKAMMALPVVFSLFLMNFPSGLVLYWLVNNCLQVLQQWYITRRIEKGLDKPKKKKFKKK
jgi:YidC/Oxa1 family membrane protein insertase